MCHPYKGKPSLGFLCVAVVVVHVFCLLFSSPWHNQFSASRFAVYLMERRAKVATDDYAILLLVTPPPRSKGFWLGCGLTDKGGGERRTVSGCDFGSPLMIC